MKTFIYEDFLLQTEMAKKLYHGYAKDLPIIDYHNHLPPSEIANNYTYKNITEVWLKGDHYKWRAMRANGISEQFITGTASDKDKFLKWAQTVPYTLRNPLYHWTHLELKRYFGINDLLNADTSEKIYETCNDLLQQKSHTAPGLLHLMKVELVCTTDDPTDSLEHHKAFSKEVSTLKMLPTFRPDKLIQIDLPPFMSSVESLQTLSDVEIHDYHSFLSALQSRIDYFESLGCIISDHGLSHLYASYDHIHNVDQIFKKKLNGQDISKTEAVAFKSKLMLDLGVLYHAKGWTMQLHLGALRNNNTRLLTQIGADVGCDSIGDFKQAVSLSNFLNTLDTQGQLPKTILYNLNPRDNEVFATMAGNFNDGSIPGKIQWGSAWWFLDQKDGMEKQINALSNLGLLSRFIGMLTDSRSFLSYPRHEYFRRLLCNLIGTDVHNGELPNDEKFLGELVSNISYHNAKKYLEC